MPSRAVVLQVLHVVKRVCAASCWLLASEDSAVQILALLLGNCFNDVIAFLGGCHQAFACPLFLGIKHEANCMSPSSTPETSREFLQVPSALRPLQSSCR